MPPQTTIAKGSASLTTPLVKKEKRQTSSRFNISKNRELSALPRLVGKYILFIFFAPASLILEEQSNKIDDSEFSLHFYITIFAYFKGVILYQHSTI